MTDKQIIIDYENICENYSKEVGCYDTFNGSCIKEQCFTYRLLQLLQAKEQESEELKKENCELTEEVSIDRDLFAEIDQLKADRKEALEQLEFIRILNTVQDTENRKLSKTLAKIKEIAEKAKKDICNNCGWRNTDSCVPEDYTCGEFIKILQKISECEVENE